MERAWSRAVNDISCGLILAVAVATPLLRCKFILFAIESDACDHACAIPGFVALFAIQANVDIIRLSFSLLFLINISCSFLYLTLLFLRPISFPVQFPAMKDAAAAGTFLFVYGTHFLSFSSFL